MVSGGDEFFLEPRQAFLGFDIFGIGVGNVHADFAKVFIELVQFDLQPVELIDRLVRLGGAWTTFRGKRLKILAVSLADSGSLLGVAACSLEQPLAGLRVLTVQPEGKAPMPYADFARGARPQSDEAFE